MGTLLISNKLRGAVAWLLPERHDGATDSVELAQDAVWSHRVRAGGLTITCHKGWVWLTREGDAEDHVLEAGDSMRLDEPGLVVVLALRPARIEFNREQSRRGVLQHEPEVPAQ